MFFRLSARDAKGFTGIRNGLICGKQKKRNLKKE